jgi:hypothetical protein
MTDFIERAKKELMLQFHFIFLYKYSLREHLQRSWRSA